MDFISGRDGSFEVKMPDLNCSRVYAGMKTGIMRCDGERFSEHHRLGV